MCKYVSIILGIIGKKKRNFRKHNKTILEYNRLKPNVNEALAIRSLLILVGVY